MRLSGKTIIVSGAAHGIGRAYSEKLASEGAGVALLDIDAKRNEEVAAGIRQNARRSHDARRSRRRTTDHSPRR